VKKPNDDARPILINRKTATCNPAFMNKGG
jgi:hypothetical protein